MRKLRDKAPETARFLATTILKHSDVDNGSQDEIECQRQDSAKLDDNAIRSTKRKSARTKDLSYRPPRSAKAKAEKSKYSNFQVKISTAPFFSVSTLCSTSLLRKVATLAQSGGHGFRPLGIQSAFGVLDYKVIEHLIQSEYFV
jgi:hypothetical protein